jgi:hypothetical protein
LLSAEEAWRITKFQGGSNSQKLIWPRTVLATEEDFARAILDPSAVRDELTKAPKLRAVRDLRSSFFVTLVQIWAFF